MEKAQKDQLLQQFPDFLSEDLDLRCAEGWLGLITNLFNEIKEEIGKPAKIYCIKEKFGELRVYFSEEGLTKEEEEKVNHLIDLTTELSRKTCELCGEEGFTRSGMWVRTLCKLHGMFENRTERLEFIPLQSYKLPK